MKRVKLHYFQKEKLKFNCTLKSLFTDNTQFEFFKEELAKFLKQEFSAKEEVGYSGYGSRYHNQPRLYVSPTVGGSSPKPELSLTGRLYRAAANDFVARVRDKQPAIISATAGNKARLEEYVYMAMQRAVPCTVRSAFGVLTATKLSALSFTGWGGQLCEAPSRNCRSTADYLATKLDFGLSGALRNLPPYVARLPTVAQRRNELASHHTIRAYLKFRHYYKGAAKLSRCTTNLPVAIHIKHNSSNKSKNLDTYIYVSKYPILTNDARIVQQHPSVFAYPTEGLTWDARGLLDGMVDLGIDLQAYYNNCQDKDLCAVSALFPYLQKSPVSTNVDPRLVWSHNGFQAPVYAQDFMLESDGFKNVIPLNILGAPKNINTKPGSRESCYMLPVEMLEETVSYSGNYKAVTGVMIVHKLTVPLHDALPKVALRKFLKVLSESSSVNYHDPEADGYTEAASQIPVSILSTACATTVTKALVKIKAHLGPKQVSDIVRTRLIGEVDDGLILLNKLRTGELSTGSLDLANLLKASKALNKHLEADIVSASAIVDSAGARKLN